MFTTTSAAAIEGAMRAWNRIAGNQNLDFEKFKKVIEKGKPSRWQQRKAADEVIKAIKKKIRKTSYNEVVDKYGYGTLVVGMPLWFAVFPEDPFRAESALDDFMVRTELGMEEIARKELRRKNCPFKHVIVLWDTTPEAIEEWDVKRSKKYENVVNTSLMNPAMLATWSRAMEEAIEQTKTKESEAPSFCLSIEKRVEKKKSGKGPYPEMVHVMENIANERTNEERLIGRIEKWKLIIALGLCKILCFLKIHGIVGLERWVTQKISPKRFLRRKASRRRAVRLYRESVRRAQRRKERIQLMQMGT